MRKSRLSEEQMVEVVKELDAGGDKEAIARRVGVSVGTLYTWKRRYSGMETPDVKRLRDLESENERLKTLVAEQALDIRGLKAVLTKKG
jgi:putative transposase